MKLCIDCKFHREVAWMHRCSRFVYESEPSRVNGKSYEVGEVECSDARRYGSCGPDGKCFEQRRGFFRRLIHPLVSVAQGASAKC